jgi:hypothetical protein
MQTPQTDAMIATMHNILNGVSDNLIRHRMATFLHPSVMSMDGLRACYLHGAHQAWSRNLSTAASQFRASVLEHRQHWEPHATSDHQADRHLRILYGSASGDDVRLVMAQGAHRLHMLPDISTLTTLNDEALLSYRDTGYLNVHLHDHKEMGTGDPTGIWRQLSDRIGYGWLSQQPTFMIRNMDVIASACGQSMGQTLTRNAANDIYCAISRRNHGIIDHAMTWMKRFPITDADMEVYGILCQDVSAKAATRVLRDTDVHAAWMTVMERIDPSRRQDLLSIPCINDVMTRTMRASAKTSNGIVDVIGLTDSESKIQKRLHGHMKHHGPGPVAAWMADLLAYRDDISMPWPAMQSAFHGYAESNRDLRKALVRTYAEKNRPIHSHLVGWIASMVTDPADHDILWTADRHIPYVATTVKQTKDDHGVIYMPVHHPISWTKRHVGCVIMAMMNSNPNAMETYLGSEVSQMHYRYDTIGYPTGWLHHIGRAMQPDDDTVSAVIASGNPWDMLRSLIGDYSDDPAMHLYASMHDARTAASADIDGSIRDMVDIISTRGTAYPSALITASMASLHEHPDMLAVVEAIHKRQ